MPRTLQVEIVGDSRKFEKSLKNATRASDKFGKVMRSSLKVAAIGAGAALGGLAVAAKIGFDEFNQGQKAAAQTAAVLKSTGSIAGITAKHVDTLALSILKKTGIDDEAVKTSENLLLGFTKLRNEAGKGNDVFDRTVKVVQDYAVRTGKSATTASIAFGKALNDPVNNMGALGRAGIKLTDDQKKLIETWGKHGETVKAQTYLLDLLEQRFGGVANAAGGTLSGQLNVLKETFKNSAAEIVGRFLPPLIQFATFIAPLVTRAMDGIANLLSRFVAPQFREVGAIASREWPKIQQTAQAVFGWIQTNVFPIIAKLRDVWNEAVKQIAKVLEEHRPELERIFDRLAAVISAVAKVAIPLLRFVLVEVLPRAIGIAITAIDKISAAIETIIKAGERVYKWFSNFSTNMGNVADAIKKWAFDLGLAIVDGIVGGIKAAPGKIKDALVGAVKGAVSAAGGILHGSGDWQFTRHDVGEPMAQGIAEGILSGKIRISEALVQAAQAAVDNAKAGVGSTFGNFSTWLSQAFGAKQGGRQTKSEKAITAAELKHQQQDLKDAITQARADLATAQAGGDPDDIKRAQKDVDEALYQQWLFDTQQKADAERKALDQQQWVEQQHFQQRLDNLQKYLESGHATAKGARDKINTLMADFGIKVGQSGELLGQAFAKGLRNMIPDVVAAARQLATALRNEGIITAGRKITVTIEEKEKAAKTKKKRALGGPVSAGQSYMVGERGPEMFTPSRSGAIIPNGAGGGSVVQFFFPNYTGDKADLMRVVSDGVRDLERNGTTLGGTRVRPGFAT